MKLRAQLIILLGSLLLGFVIMPFGENVEAQTVKRDAGKSKKALEAGDKLFRQKNFRDAIAQFEESIKFDASNEEAHFLKGYSHFFVKEYDQALEHLNQAESLKYKPLLELYRVRASVQYERKDYEGAMADIRRVVEAEPRNVQYLKLAGDVSLMLKNYDEALAIYQKLSAASPNDGNILYAIAQLYAAKGDLDNQVAFGERAIKAGTQNFVDAQLLLVDAYTKQGKPQQVEVALLKVIEVKPDRRDIYRRLSELYRSQSRFSEAIDITRKAIKQFANDGELYTDASWYYSLAGRHEEAVQAAQAGIRFSPERSMAYTNLCRAYNDLQKPELAISACNNALKIQPNDGETYFYLGRAHDLLDKPAEATKLYKQAVTGLETFTAENPTYSDGFYLLGNAYFADGQFDKAIAAYSKSLEMSPRFARARYNIGMVQLQKNNKPGATEQYNILVGIDRALATKLKTEIDKVADKP
jgi:tetratricopeptide (TPR) repeat protein